MNINSREAASEVIDGAYAKMRQGQFRLPGEDPALLALLNDIEQAEEKGPEIQDLERQLENVRLTLEYRSQGADVEALNQQEEELQSRLQQLRVGQGISHYAFEVRSLLRDAGKIE